MNIQDSWEKALKNTEIIRPRVHPLETFATTQLPYVFLAELDSPSHNTIVRKGEVMVEKPSLLLPTGMPHFEGFDFESEMQINEDFLASFFLVRGVHFPSLKFNNKIDASNVYQGGLSDAIKHHKNQLQQNENVHTGLITGPSDCWQFSVLIFIGSQMTRSAEGDFKKIFQDYHRRGLMS